MLKVDISEKLCSLYNTLESEQWLNSSLWKQRIILHILVTVCYYCNDMISCAFVGCTFSKAQHSFYHVPLGGNNLDKWATSQSVWYFTRDTLAHTVIHYISIVVYWDNAKITMVKCSKINAQMVHTLKWPCQHPFHCILTIGDSVWISKLFCRAASLPETIMQPPAQGNHWLSNILTPYSG